MSQPNQQNQDDTRLPVDKGMLQVESTKTASEVRRQRLQAGEASFQLLFYHNPLPMWVLDQETLRFLEVNEAAVAAYGHARSDFLQMQITDLLPPDEPWRSCERHRLKDGRLIDVKLSCHLLDYAQRPAALVVVQDVTESKRAREAVEIREKHFRHLIENAMDLITILNGDGTIRFESPSMEKVLGYKPEDYLGKNAFDFVHPDDLTRVTQAFIEALQRPGDTPPLTFRFRHKDGSWRILEGVGNNLLADPVMAGIVFNSRDVTERKRLEEQYLQSQKVQAIGRLAGGLAHDFNNVLTAIIGFSDMALQHLTVSHPSRSNIQEVRKAADRAAALTRQLLAFSRKQILEPKVINLNHSVSDMNKMLRRLLGEDIQLALVLEEKAGRVRVDPGQMEQVILNLAVNARDAMPRGGRLTIQTANVTLDREYAQIHAEVAAGEYLVLSVSDTGTGMTPEVQRHLFEPFFTTKEQGRGTGLGLATCHGIVKQSGGHITVYSEPDKGAVFKIYLPIVQQPVEPVARRAEAVRLPRGHETILMVEDEPVLLDLAILVLSSLGYNVLTADNGRQALKLLQSKPDEIIDLVITDMVMPEMGGRELAEELEKISPKTRVLFCSGYTQDVVVRGGMLGQDAAFLHKPYSTEAFARKIREILDQ